MWIDSTLFVSSPIVGDWISESFMTLRMHSYLCPQEACMGKWTNFCISGSSHNVIFEFICESFEWYYRYCGSRIPDYVFLDYILLVAYRNLPQARAMIDSVPYNNEYVWELKNNLEVAYDEDEWSHINIANTFHKLAHQVEYNKSTQDGRQTFYGHLCSMYGI
jgi:hypothetical protein